MAPIFLPRVVVLVVALMAVISDQCEAHILTLERLNDTGVDLMRRRDGIRHGRLLQQQQQQQATGVVDFPVQGTFNPYLAGLYYTRLQLGTPPQEFYVQIDTGSDVLWVSCNPCNGCPKSTTLDIKLHFFDPTISSTSSSISCTDKRCSDSGCINHNQCGYTINYADGTATSGYYISDSMVLDIMGNSNKSTPIVFGCSTSVTGGDLGPNIIVDGILGFGHRGRSVISQLASQGITPHVFSHCLKGDDHGGGFMVIGEILKQNMVYTSLLPTEPHYNVILENIAVNGRALPLSPSSFASDYSGVAIDSGTTFAYFAEEAYDAFFTAFTQAISPSVRRSRTVSNGLQCYIISSSVTESFPIVDLYFHGGASMKLMPQDYLYQQILSDSQWCLGFLKSEGRLTTILGDLVLKDKIVVYDLAARRIGWANHNCSSTANISISNPGRDRNNSPVHYKAYNVILSLFTAFLLSQLLHFN